MILSKKWRWTKALALTLVLVALSCSSNDNGTPDTGNTPPTINDQTVNAPEDSAPGEVFGSVSATDEDSNNTLVFSISQDEDDLFDIITDSDSDTGLLILGTGKSFDRAAKAQHTIEVTVSDGTAQSSANVTINVTAEGSGQGGAPIFQNPPVGAIEVAEDITDQDVIVALKAEDPEGDEFTFSILEDDDALFEINQDGELSLLAGKQLNAEESDSHSVTVAVKDSNGNQATLQLTLTVLEAMALQDDPDAFLTTWSVGDNDKIFIRVNPDYDDYDYQIDWGDGSPVENVTGNGPPEHIYETAGNYQVAIKGTFPAIQLVPELNQTDEEIENAAKLTSIDQWGNNVWRTMIQAFFGCVNMTYTAEDTPELGEVTNMSQMFLNCSSFNGDIGDWDVSAVIVMSATFGATSSFDQDISGWDVSNVISMEGMFLASKFNQDLSSWGNKLGNVQKMVNMFLNNSFFEGLGLEEWNVGNVTSMRGMFSGATVFNGDIEAWDTGNVTSMAGMFKDATAFDRNLGAWDLSSIEPGTDNGSDFDSLEGMLDNSGLSTENYANTLIGWWNEDTPSDINLGAANLKYCSSALTAKSFLQIEFKWDIIDSGSAACN